MKNSKAVGYSITLLSGVTQILGFVILTKYAYQYLNARELKLFFLVLASTPFFALMELGANITMPQLLSVKFKTGQGKYESIVSFLYVAGFFYSIYAVIIFIAILIAYLQKILNESDIVLISSLIFVGAFRVIGNISHAALYSLGFNVYEKIIRIINICFILIISCTGMMLGFGVYSVIFSWLVASAISLSIGWRRLRNVLSVEHLISKPNFNEVGSLALRSIKYLGVAIPGVAIYNSSAFIIAHKLNSEAIIEFGLIQQIVAGVSLVSMLPLILYMPSIVEEYKEKKININLKNMIIEVSIISMFLLVIIGSNFQEIIFIWLNKSNSELSLFAFLYFIAIFIEWQQSTLTTASIAVGNLKYIAITIFSGLLILISMPILIDIYGLPGVPISILLSQGLTCHPYNIYKSLKTYNLKFKNYCNYIFPSVILAIVMLMMDYVFVKVGLPVIYKLLLSVVFALVFGLFVLKRNKVNENYYEN